MQVVMLQHAIRLSDCNVWLLQALVGEVEWQTFLEPEVDEGYSGVAVWGSMPPVDPIRNQAKTTLSHA